MRTRRKKWERGSPQGLGCLEMQCPPLEASTLGNLMEVKNCSYQWSERTLTKVLIKGPRRLTLSISTNLVYNIWKALSTTNWGLTATSVFCLDTHHSEGYSCISYSYCRKRTTSRTSGLGEEGNPGNVLDGIPLMPARESICLSR